MLAAVFFSCCTVLIGAVPVVLAIGPNVPAKDLKELIAYKGGPKQLWDNKDLGGPWLNLMRNNLNVHQISFKHPDFIIVSATHAIAHLAMYDQMIWDKYQLSKLTNGAVASNRFIVEQAAATASPANYNDPEGAFSGSNNSIPALQRRGAVFFACHNSIWEQSEALIKNGVNPDKLSHEALAAAPLDLLLWPETVYPTTFGAPKSPDGAAFDRAIGQFAAAYARQTVRDHAALLKAIKSKRLPDTASDS